MFIDELFVFIQQLLPAFELREVLDLLRGGSRPLQLLENALHMVPFFHLPSRFTERVWYDLSDTYDTLCNLVLALFASCSATFGIFHEEPLFRHVHLVGETLTHRNDLGERVFTGYQREVTEFRGKM